MFEQESTYVREIPEGCVHCDQCGAVVPEEQAAVFGSCTICWDCEREYCSSQADELSASYIAQHEKEFYLDWYLEDPEVDLVSIVKEHYQKKKQEEAQRRHSVWLEYAADNEKEFCVQSSDWVDFVKEHAS